MVTRVWHAWKLFIAGQPSDLSSPGKCYTNLEQNVLVCRIRQTRSRTEMFELENTKKQKIVRMSRWGIYHRRYRRRTQDWRTSYDTRRRLEEISCRRHSTIQHVWFEINTGDLRCRTKHKYAVPAISPKCAKSGFLSPLPTISSSRSREVEDKSGFTLHLTATSDWSISLILYLSMASRYACEVSLNGWRKRILFKL